MPTVSFFLLLLSYCYPDWINGTITYFPNTCILTCPLLLSFLLLFFLLAHCFFFFLSLYSYCYPDWLNQMNCYLFFLFLFSYLPTITFSPVTFFPTCPLLFSFLLLFFLLLFFLPETVTFFPVTFFLLLSFRAPRYNATLTLWSGIGLAYGYVANICKIAPQRHSVVELEW